VSPGREAANHCGGQRGQDETLQLGLVTPVMTTRVPLTDTRKAAP
jgi:hypothetical protein